MSSTLTAADCSDFRTHMSCRWALRDAHRQSLTNLQPPRICSLMIHHCPHFIIAVPHTVAALLSALHKTERQYAVQKTDADYSTGCLVYFIAVWSCQWVPETAWSQQNLVPCIYTRNAHQKSVAGTAHHFQTLTGTSLSRAGIKMTGPETIFAKNLSLFERLAILW